MAITSTTLATSTLLNSTTPEEEEDDGEVWPMRVKVGVGITVVLIIIGTIVGNLLTIASFIRDKRLQTLHNYFILNLAVADLLIGVVSMPWYTTYTLHDYTWLYGPTMCKAFNVFDYTMCLETILVMCLISVDTFLLMHYGATYSLKQTRRRVLAQIACSWVIAFSLYSPCIIGWDYWVGYSSVEEEDCDVEFNKNYEYTLATAMFECFLPIILMGVLNVQIYRKISRMNKKKTGMQAKKDSITVVKSIEDEKTIIPVATAKKGNDAQSSIANRQRRLAHRLAILVIIFVICWAPFTISTIVNSLCTECFNSDAYEFQTWLLWSKSCFNPILYALGSQVFKENFKYFLYIRQKTKVRPMEDSTKISKF